MTVFITTVFIAMTVFITIFWHSENAIKSVPQEIQIFTGKKHNIFKFILNLFFKQQKNNRWSFVEPCVSRVPPREFRPIINWFYSPSFEMLHFKTAEKVSTNRTMSTNRMSTSRAMDCIKLHLHGAISPTPTWVIHCRLIGLLKCASNATASCVCFIFSWSAFFW